jgi:ATP-dependent Clp endopeptidase proteolytic subunit ClpP
VATRKHEQSPQDRIDNLLLDNHMFFLNGDIDIDNIDRCIRWIEYENINSTKPTVLTLYINSTGGDLYQTFALIDIMRSSKHPIRTIGLGSIMSGGFLIFVCGTKGERYIAANAGIMCHQLSDDITDKYHDIKSAVKEVENCNAKMIKILRDATGLSALKISAKLLPASDVYLTAKELIQLNAADYILGEDDGTPV